MGGTHPTGHDYSADGRGATATGQIGNTIRKTVRDGDDVDQAYREFADDSGLTDRQGKTISDRRDVLEEALREDLAVRDSRLIGSFTRRTVTGPMKRDTDADMMVVLDAQQHRQWIEQENGPQNCLRAIKRRIQNDSRFSETDVEIDQNAVQVKYHDSTIEIVPAFRYSEVPQAEHPREGLNLFNDASDGYAIPDTHGQESWVGTNPREYKQRFDARNEAHNGHVAGLARTMKKWSENNEVPTGGYPMEVMVYNYFAEKAKTGDPVPDSYHDLAREFMHSLPQRIRGTPREPIYGGAVDKGWSHDDREEAAEKAKRAAQKLEEAKELKEQGRTEAAKRKLRETYGEGFRN